MTPTEAAQSIRRLAKQYEAMVAAADALERLGQLEDAESAARARVEALQRDAAALEAQKLEFSAWVTAEQAKAETARADASAQAAELVSAAEARASEDYGAALEAAEAVKAEAAAAAARIITTAEREAADLREQLAGLAADTATAEARRDAAIAQADEAEKRLAMVREAAAELAKGV